MAYRSYENSNSEGVMLEGDYEVQLIEAAETVTRTSGKECIEFHFVVRDDIEQKYKRKHIFKKYFKDDNGRYPEEKIGKMANALGIAKDTDFELHDLDGLCCILHIRPYTRQDGTKIDSIYFAKATEAGQLIQPAQSNDFVEVEDDLPF